MRADMENESSKLLHAELTEKIIGVYYDVYNEIGHGFLEAVYRNAMEIALTEAGLLVQREVPVPVRFRGQEVGTYRADLLVANCIVLELKAVSALDRSHEAQLLHYLRATEVEIGLLFNFGGPKPQFRRIVPENTNKRIRVHQRESAVGGPSEA
jgi:GxxExxY protein